ncbi:MAG: hypothetical protein NZ908_02705 [Candidatus Micrarchaeota archaeon]|nr:hypothetical protein [Candidatus Micrarchaeota archaeon]
MDYGVIDLEIKYNELFFTSRLTDENSVNMFKQIVVDVMKEIYHSKLSFLSYPVTKEDYRKLFDEIINNLKDLFVQKLSQKIQELKEMLTKNNIINLGKTKFMIEESIRKKIISLISKKNLYLKIFGYMIFPFVAQRQNNTLKN